MLTYYLLKALLHLLLGALYATLLDMALPTSWTGWWLRLASGMAGMAPLMWDWPRRQLRRRKASQTP